MISSDLIPDGVPLSAVPGLTGAQVETLRDLWIDTAQQLVGIYAASEVTRLRLASTLGIQRNGLDAIMNTAQRLVPRTPLPTRAALEVEVGSTDYPLGALLEDPAVTLTRMAGLSPYVSAIRGPLPESHNLLHQLPPLRGQGGRPTCVAHAAVAVREQLEIAAGATPDLDLSEQYVYWWCKERDGLPARHGTFLSLGMRCIKQAGAPPETLWPYAPKPTSDQGQGPPPPAAAQGEPAFRAADIQEFSRKDIDGMKACLVEGRSIAFAFPVFDSWYKSAAMARWGKITMPLPGETMRDGHAVTIVGYQDDATTPGGGYFLLRNSWQPWAWDGVWQPGYGYIPYAYINRHASAIFSAQRGEDARPCVRGEDAEGHPGLIVNSPDIWSRQAPDGGTEPQPALEARDNALYVRITNPGPRRLYRVFGEIYFRRPGAGNWERGGGFADVTLHPGENVVGPLLWQPPFTGKFVLAVRLW